MNQTTTLPGPDGEAIVRELPGGRREVRVIAAPGGFVAVPGCDTAYPLDLIAHILEVKGVAWLCDEIRRDEDPSYVTAALHNALLSYVDPAEAAGRRLLDFGCGAGASTQILARLLPAVKEIVGVELDAKLLSIARARAAHYGTKHVVLAQSPSGDRLPSDFGRFDWIVLSAVFEHLLPAERQHLVPLLWRLLRPGGILFVNQTPNRRFPVETHTTWLPFLNYLPDRAKNRLAHLSPRVRAGATWEDLLRAGIVGATTTEVQGVLAASGDGVAELIQPHRLGAESERDIWCAIARDRAAHRTGLRATGLRAAAAIVGLLPWAPMLSLAFRKSGGAG